MFEKRLFGSRGGKKSCKHITPQLLQLIFEMTESTDLSDI